MKCLLRPLLLLALAAALPAQAMYLNPRGTGQVLLFPYYTVNAGQTTLISLVNTTAKAKALRIQFREAYNAREVMDFSLFLGPHDSWTGAVGSNGDTSAGFVLTRDESCTAPGKDQWNAASGGGWSVALYDFAYTAGNADTGPTDLARTHEGHLAVFELAQLEGPLAAAVDSDGARQCQVVREIDPSDPALRAPGGGIAGSFAIVDVAQGTILGGSATAIDDFSRVPLYTDTPIYDHYLGVGNSGVGDTVQAEIFVAGRLAKLDYPTQLPSQAVDAVSAVLAADSLQADITREANIGSFSEWVLTAPTKRAYTDNRMLGVPFTPFSAGTAPYEEVFGIRPGGSCSRFEASGHDREGNPVAFAPDAPTVPGSAVLPGFSLCHSTDVVYFGAKTPSGTTPVLGSRLGVNVWNPQPAMESGNVLLSFAKRNDGTPRILRPDRNGISLRGLPLIAFEAIKYVNGNVLPGVLANYTYALPLIPATLCTNEQGAVVACP